MLYMNILRSFCARVHARVFLHASCESMMNRMHACVYAEGSNNKCFEGIMLGISDDEPPPPPLVKAGYGPD